MKTIAIDVGKTGGIAELEVLAGKCLGAPRFYEQPLNCGEWDPWLMNRQVFYWQQNGVERILIEKVHAMPADFRGPVAGHELSLAYGMWLAALASKFPPERVRSVPAATWKKVMGILLPIEKAGRVATKEEKDRAYKARKLKAVEEAERRCPSASFRTPKGRLLDGQAEACLLAFYEDELLHQNRVRQESLFRG